MAQNVSTNRGQDTSAVKKPVKRVEKKVGRNDPCPCGSGLKYNNCCGSECLIPVRSVEKQLKKG